VYNNFFCTVYILYISVTDGDDSEETAFNQPQHDPDSAQQCSTNHGHDGPSDDVHDEENTNSRYVYKCLINVSFLSAYIYIVEYIPYRRLSTHV